MSRSKFEPRRDELDNVDKRNKENTENRETETDAELEEKVKMTRLRQTIARRLKESQNTAAMLTTYNEADMTAILKIRSEFKDQFFSKTCVFMND